ncbi:phosphotransferase [Rossellomorea sp. SC111]|uniref:phosphotransferase n=1 Tax=Rossellomorea sp. SC111 TaxID=2968985 RepID=UPI00215A40BC|nr:phosphotransferase [Rossellomorea sp. SC111]MCR8848988.1 phosphotransferase [Rossellomorea sp. SC111]
MPNLWDAEVAVTSSQAKKLIESQFPELIPADIKILDYGFDNTVMVVNNDWVFRFPRREIAVRLLKTEGVLLPLLDESGPDLQIPVPAYYGKPSSLYKWPFLGYRFVKGTIPSESSGVMREGESAIKLARFLKKLHGTTVAGAEKHGVPYDELSRLDVVKRHPILEKNMEEIKDLNLFHPMEKLERFLQNLPSKALPEELTLVHGDLHFKNIVVDKEGTLSGVLDWGDVHLGHRAIDLNLIYSFLTPKGRTQFLKEYGEVGEEELDYARFKAVYTNVVLLLYGYHESQPHTVVEAQQSLKLALT